MQHHTLYKAVNLLIVLVFPFLWGCGSDDDDSISKPGTYSVTAGVGVSANDILSDKVFKSLVVEVAYMPGMKLSTNTVNEVKAFFESRTHKGKGIQILEREIPSMNKAVYTATDIRNWEKEYRTTKPSGDKLSIWVCVVDGEYDNSGVVGIAYQNLSCALMGKTIADNSGGLTQPTKTKIETTIFLHEIGHLLGLVDIGSPMVKNHSAHGNHCDNENCLMYYAVENTDFFSVLGSSPVPSLDANCLNDLKANGGK